MAALKSKQLTCKHTPPRDPEALLRIEKTHIVLMSARFSDHVTLPIITWREDITQRLKRGFYLTSQLISLDTYLRSCVFPIKQRSLYYMLLIIPFSLNEVNPRKTLLLATWTQNFFGHGVPVHGIPGSAFRSFTNFVKFPFVRFCSLLSMFLENGKPLACEHVVLYQPNHSCPICWIIRFVFLHDDFFVRFFRFSAFQVTYTLDDS